MFLFHRKPAKWCVSIKEVEKISKTFESRREVSIVDSVMRLIVFEFFFQILHDAQKVIGVNLNDSEF